MKHVLLIACFLLFPVGIIVAQTASPSPSPSPTSVNKQVEDLKERLATKVAQLRQSEKRAIYGTVKTVTISTLTV